VILSILGFLAAVGGAIRLVNAVREWFDKKHARMLAEKMSENLGLGSLTAEEVAAACKNYIEPNCTQVDPSDDDDLRNVVALAPLFRTIDEHFALGGEKRHVILLADSGMGKTTFCLNYYAREMKKKKSVRRDIVIVPLGRGDGIEQLKKIQDRRNAVLFLDAFDEDPEAAEDHKDRLFKLMSAASGFRNIVLTCRSQFFSKDEDVPKGSGIVYAAPRRAGIPREFPLHKLFLAPLNASQIDIFLRKHFPRTRITNWGKRREARKLVDAIPELSVRPMLLELLPDLVRDRKVIDQLFGLYRYLVAQWLKRERDWIEEDDLLRISIEIAVVTFLRQKRGEGDRIEPSYLDEVSSNFHRPLETWKLKSRSLLNRDIEGMYKFAHRSVMEYLFLVAAIEGDPRCFGVEWTDLMKDLFVSWGNIKTKESEVRALQIFSFDLTETALFPLASPLRQPQRVSLSDCRGFLKNENISIRHSRKIPVAWRNIKLHVNIVSDDGKTKSYEVQDPTHGLVWLVNDVSQQRDGALRALYRDVYLAPGSEVASEVRNGSQMTGLVKRLPSIEELLMLWESEPYLEEVHGLAHVFDPDELYWLGDSGDSGPYLCSFSKVSVEQPYMKLVASRIDGSGRCVHLYEFQNRYAIVGKVQYRAMCVFVFEPVSSIT